MNRVAAGLILCVAMCIVIGHVHRAAASTEKVIYSFCTKGGCADGATPKVHLTELNDVLYGTTYSGGANNGGVAFALDPESGAQTVLHSFGGSGDGRYPKAGLLNVDGTFYGTTEEGGAHGGGALYELDPNTGTETILYSFCSVEGCADGKYPDGDLVYLKGKLYGTTTGGGPFPRNTGTAFAFDLNSGKEEVLHAFSGGKGVDTFSLAGADGGNPAAGLIQVNGALYGTTYVGGSKMPCFAGAGCGIVFSLDLASGAESIRHVFKNNGKDGFNPLASLIEAKGVLYGTTSYGGSHAEGTVFSLDPQTGLETIVYPFCGLGFCPDGATPTANLLNVNGTLYGTTSRGGTASDACKSVVCGTVFSIDLKSGTETTMYGFCTDLNCADGEAPLAGLIDVGGVLYGTTSMGGTGEGSLCSSRYGCGTVFAITP